MSSPVWCICEKFHATKKKCRASEQYFEGLCIFFLYFPYAQQKKHEHWSGLQEWISLMLATKMKTSVQLHFDVSHTSKIILSWLPQVIEYESASSLISVSQELWVITSQVQQKDVVGSSYSAMLCVPLERVVAWLGLTMGRRESFLLQCWR